MPEDRKKVEAEGALSDASAAIDSCRSPLRGAAAAIAAAGPPAAKLAGIAAAKIGGKAA